MMDYDEFTEAPEDYFEPSTPDHYFLQAQKEIRELYEEDRESVYYIRQIQVKFEKKYMLIRLTRKGTISCVMLFSFSECSDVPISLYIIPDKSGI